MHAFFVLGKGSDPKPCLASVNADYAVKENSTGSVDRHFLEFLGLRIHTLNVAPRSVIKIKESRNEATRALATIRRHFRASKVGGLWTSQRGLGTFSARFLVPVASC